MFELKQLQLQKTKLGVRDNILTKKTDMFWTNNFFEKVGGGEGEGKRIEEKRERETFGGGFC